MTLQCAACGAEAGKYSIHRDGFDEGPEVPLCKSCGAREIPTCEELWLRIRSRSFAKVLARAFASQLIVNPHRENFYSVRTELENLAACDEDITEDLIAACEASGEIWRLIWWSSSCGHYSFTAPSYDELVTRVLAVQDDLRRAGSTWQDARSA